MLTLLLELQGLHSTMKTSRKTLLGDGPLWDQYDIKLNQTDGGKKYLAPCFLSLRGRQDMTEA